MSDIKEIPFKVKRLSASCSVRASRDMRYAVCCDSGVTMRYKDVVRVRIGPYPLNGFGENNSDEEDRRRQDSPGDVYL
ncbi:hypothetical protein, partial [Xanthomonas hortorum]